MLGWQLRCKTSTVCSICQVSPIFFLSFLPDFTVRIPGWIVWAVGPKWRGFFFQQNVAYPNRRSYTKWRSYTIWGPYEIFMCARLGACRALSRASPGSLSVAKNTPRLIAVVFSSFTTFFTGQALMLCQNEKNAKKVRISSERNSGNACIMCHARPIMGGWVPHISAKCQCVQNIVPHISANGVQQQARGRSLHCFPELLQLAKCHLHLFFWFCLDLAYLSILLPPVTWHGMTCHMRTSDVPMWHVIVTSHT